MSQTANSGFIIDTTKPIKKGYVVRLVVTPYRVDGGRGVDPSRKLMRDVGEHRAIGLALELLAACPSVPPGLLMQLESLKAQVSRLA